MKKYRAFISYSQQDKVWARRIQKSLETYRVPLGVAVDGLVRRKLGRFFRDDDELAGEPSLGDALQGAIRDSENMIVIASPNAARSKWVNEEIRTFKQTHGSNRIFAMIVAGRPFASEEGAPDEECFPLALRRVVAPDGTITDQQDEPLAPDVTKDRLPRIRARLAAGLLGLDFDVLWQRDRRRRRQNACLVTSGAAVMAAGIAGGLFLLTASQREALLQESRLLAEQAQGLIDERQLDSALKLIVRALPAKLDAPDRPVAPEALVALTRIMADNADVGVVAQFDSAVDAMVTTPDQKVVARLRDGSFAMLAEGQTVRSYTPEAYMTLLPNGNALRLFSDERKAEDRWVFDQDLSEVNVATGEEIGGFAFTDQEAAWSLTFGVASYDGGLIAGRGSNGRPGQVAVFDRQIPASKAPQKPIAILKTDIEHIGDAKLAFAGDQTLVLFKADDARHLLLRWSIGASSYDQLRSNDASAECSQPVTTTLAKAHATISPEGDVISLAEPTGMRSWCITSWDSSTGTQIQRTHVEDLDASMIQPLSRDRWLAVPGASFFRPSPVVLSADGERWKLLGCDGTSGLITNMSLNPSQTDVLFLDDNHVACRAGSDILVQRAGSPALYLSSHSADISALAVTRDANGAARLWSGDRAGMVRMWDLDWTGTEPEPGRSWSPIIARSAQSMAIVSADAADRGMALSVWTLYGGERLAPKLVDLLPEIKVRGSTRQAALRVLGDDMALLTEAFLCPLGLVDDPPTDCTLSTGRATVLDLKTGLALLELDDLERGGPDLVPLAIAENAIVLVSANGALHQVDLTTQQHVTMPSPPEGQVRDIAFVDNALWAITIARLPEESEHQWRLYRRTAAQWDLVLDQQLNEMSLHPAPDHGKATVLSETLSTIQAQVIDGAGVTVEGAPFEKRTTQTPLVIQPPGYPGALLLNEDGINALQNDGEMRALPAFSMAVEYDFLKRAKLSDDHATLVWLGYSKAHIFSLPEGQPMCTGLSFSDPKDVVFSPDGTRMAIKDDNAQGVMIVDLPTCAIVRRLPAEGERPMILADNDTLWQTAEDGRQLISAKTEPQQLLDRARQLVDTLQ